MTTTEKTITREVPVDFNGYVYVARPALTIPAYEVREGDILLLDVYVSRVSSVDVYDLGSGKSLNVLEPRLSVPEIVAKYSGGPRWPVLHIGGDVGLIRGTHEIVRVIRPDGAR